MRQFINGGLTMSTRKLFKLVTAAEAATAAQVASSYTVNLHKRSMSLQLSASSSVVSTLRESNAVLTSSQSGIMQTLETVKPSVGYLPCTAQPCAASDQSFMTVIHTRTLLSAVEELRVRVC